MQVKEHKDERMVNLHQRLRLRKLIEKNNFDPVKFGNNVVRFFFDPTQAWTNYVRFPFAPAKTGLNLVCFASIFLCS
jgi:hypothetical protein